MNVFDLHRNGKIEIKPKIVVKDYKDLSLVYTPGVAKVSEAIYKNKRLVNKYTIKKNSVGIVTDGSSVLGLGDIGAEAALPVMEGKAMLFKQLANIDAFPICLNTKNPLKIIETVKNISPVFGAINLEDISAPRCFEIEEKLQNIGIPVMHDDQHGTAIVVLAGLINSCKVLNKKFDDLKVVVNGAGAAGNAIAKLLVCADYHSKICKSVCDIIVCDSKGIIYEGRKNLNKYKKKLAELTNRNKVEGYLEDALENADVFIGVSVGNVLNKKMIKNMKKNPVIFALANPVPEIMPNLAKKFGAKIIATGRSDFPNQVNNALAFPGVFRGVLNIGAKKITDLMKINAAYALAKTVKKTNVNKILPSIFNKKVVDNISKAVMKS